MVSRFPPAVSRGSGTCRTENRSQVSPLSCQVTPPQWAPRPAVRLIGEWRFAPPAKPERILPYLIYSGPNRALFITSFDCKKGNQIIVGGYKNESFPSAWYFSWKTWFAVTAQRPALKFVQDTWVKSASFMSNMCFWTYPWRCELGNCDTKPFECN